MKIKFDFSDILATSSDIDTAGRLIEYKARQVVSKSAFEVMRRGQLRVRVDTGNLRNSIGVDFYDNGLTAEIGPSAYYGYFVEYGTSRMPPYPFMGPAYNDVEPSFVEALRQVAGGVF